MNARSIPIVGIALAAAAAFGASALGLAQGTSRAVSVPVCIKSNVFLGTP